MYGIPNRLFLSGSKGRKTPLMFFEGSTTGLHGTICLRGDPRDVLKRAKIVMKFAMHVAYNLKLEAKLMNDHRACYGGIASMRLSSIFEKSIYIKFSSPVFALGSSGKRSFLEDEDYYKSHELRSSSPFLTFPRSRPVSPSRKVRFSSFVCSFLLIFCKEKGRGFFPVSTNPSGFLLAHERLAVLSTRN